MSTQMIKKTPTLLKKGLRSLKVENIGPESFRENQSPLV